MTAKHMWNDFILSIERKFTLYVLGVFYILLYFTSEKFAVDIGVKILPIDFFVAVSIFFYVLYAFSKGKMHRVMIPYVIILLFALLTLFVSLDVLRVDWPAKNITLVLALMRNFAIVFLVGSLAVSDISAVTFLVNISIIISCVSIGEYFFYLQDLHHIVNNSALWKPGIWYNLGNMRDLRLTGPMFDPNFFGMTNLVGFLYSLFLFNKGLWYKIGSIIIFVSIVLTFSRMIFVIMALLVFLFPLLSLLLKQKPLIRYVSHIYVRKFFIIFILFTFAAFYVGNLSLPDIILKRFGEGIESGFTGRFELWERAFHFFHLSPIIGMGGKTLFIESGLYAHNDYLEMISSYGMTGLLMLLFFLASNIFLAPRYIGNNLLKTGSYVILLAIVVFMGGFSVFFNSFLFFVLGILWGNSYESKVASHNRGASPSL